MPKLDERAVIEWLTEVRPVTAAEEWPSAIRPIEAVADVPQAFEELGGALDELSKDTLEVLSLAIRTTPAPLSANHAEPPLTATAVGLAGRVP